MKRSRSGCRTCRARKIKCDEERPYCRTCLKRGVKCSYEINFQWIPHTEFKAPQTTEGKLRQGRGSSYKPRRGPFSRNRAIGQEAIGAKNILGPEALEKLETVMTETPFTPDEEVISQLDCPGSVQMFRKFSVHKRRCSTEIPAMEFTMTPSNDVQPLSLTQPSLVEGAPNAVPAGVDLHSPLFRPAKLGSEFDYSFDRLPTPSSQSGMELEETTNLPPSCFLYDPSVNSEKPQLYSSTAGVNSLLSLTEQDFFNHFVNVTADELVPIPYETNPFLTTLPQLAMTENVIWDLLVAYGASHKSMLTHGLDQDPLDDQWVQKLISRCVVNLEHLRASENRHSLALLTSCVLAMIEVDRGDPKGWQFFMIQALEIIRSRANFSSWELGREINSISFRLVGYMSGLGSLSHSSMGTILSFPSWPEWSGSLDYLTGIDLNLLPLYSESAELINQINVLDPNDLRSRARINSKALRIIQRMNDYWLDEYWPDSEITAMCVMFQQALQIHVLRRILLIPMDSYIVQRLIELSISTLDKWVPPTSTMQRSMSFILGTLASETLVAEHRTSLLVRLKHMALAGFAYNWKLCDDIRKHWEDNTSLITSRVSNLIV